MSKFERGDLDFDENDALVVVDIIKKAEEIIEALQFTGRTNESFITGVKIIAETDGYNHMRMLDHCRKCRSSYAQMSKLTDQLIEFERIYNKGTRSQDRLFFSDYMRNKGSNVRDYSRNRTYDGKDISTLKEA